jgi:uncharacterized protein YjbI with pentapeptide repeats
VDGFRYADADLRELDLYDTHLSSGRVSGITTRRTRLEQVRADSVEFTGCDLAQLHWTGEKISRTVFRDCKLMGATLDDITLDNVVFEGCKLDYTAFTRVRATSPVIFAKCSLREAAFAACDLGAALFDDCDLRLAEFDGGKFRGLDLRGNDLSGLRGVTSLKKVVIDRAQILQLAEALAAELDVTYGEDLDNT